MVDPALFGARTDVEVHALDRAERADRVAAALEDVVDSFGLEAFFPALAGLAGFAPASRFLRAGRAGGGLAPAVDLFAGKRRALRDVDQRVDGARIVDLVVGIAEVSEVPGRAWAKICHSRSSCGMPEMRISETRMYWLPTRPERFSHLGCSGSSGGLAGLKATWQEAQAVPIRKGGSTEASASLRTLKSERAGRSTVCGCSPPNCRGGR